MSVDFDSLISDFNKAQVLLSHTTPLPSKRSRDPLINALVKANRIAKTDMAKICVGVINAFVTQERIVSCLSRKSIRAIAISVGAGFRDDQYKKLVAVLIQSGTISLVEQASGFAPMIVELTSPDFVELIVSECGAADFQKVRTFQIKEAREFVAKKKTKKRETADVAGEQVQRSLEAKQKIDVHAVAVLPGSTIEELKTEGRNTLRSLLSLKLGYALESNDWRNVVAAMIEAGELCEQLTGGSVDILCTKAEFMAMIDSELTKRFKANDRSAKFRLGGEVHRDFSAKLEKAATRKFAFACEAAA